MCVCVCVGIREVTLEVLREAVASFRIRGIYLSLLFRKYFLASSRARMIMINDDRWKFAVLK